MRFEIIKVVNGIYEIENLESGIYGEFNEDDKK